MKMQNSITDVREIKVGHYTDSEAATGCTVILCEEGCSAGVDIRGSASATRHIDPLQSTSLTTKAHAILLSGGSAFGMDAAGGVMRYLEEHDYGFDTGVAKVPTVPAAIIFDLHIGSSKVRPGIEEGYKACLAASGGPVAEGCVGAGTGATVGNILGTDRMVKSGLGTAGQMIGNVTIGVIIVVNAFGDIFDPATGKIIAGPRDIENGGFLDTIEIMKSLKQPLGPFFSNTVIGVVATDADLDREQTSKLAQMTQTGLAKAIRPVHTMMDGDTMFAIATGKVEAIDINLLGAVAAELAATAILRAVRQAESLASIPAIKDINPGRQD
ncbi:MAG: P1 family peptidase [Chloroflexota bacterium]|nr:P1 family peptidase [Chloroflexota bacterium]